MDPLSHALLGSYLYSLVPRENRVPGLAAGAVGGALAPDADIMLVPFGFDIYLRHHEAGTHSLVGALVLAGLFSFLLVRPSKTWRWRPVFLMSWCGTWSHVLSDCANSGDIRLLSPLLETRFGWHLFSMGDPLILVPFLVGLLLVRGRQWLPPHRGMAVFTVILGVLVLKQLSKTAADDVFAREMRAHNERVATPRHESVWSSPFVWRYLGSVAGERRIWRVNSRTGNVELLWQMSRPANDAVTLASQAQPVVQRLLAIGELPVAWTERNGEEVEVRWSDAKFCGVGGCQISFGVSLDTGGRPIRQFVLVGPLRQERSAAVQQTRTTIE